MKTRLKGQVTEGDLAKLRLIHHDLCLLSVGMNPAAPCSVALMATLFTVRQCILEWSGDPSAFLNHHLSQAGLHDHD